MLRRIRAALVLSVLWGIAWLPLGIGAMLLFGYYQDLPTAVRELGFFMLLGAASGAVFSTLVAAFERRGTVDRLSPPRLALWGGTAGGLIPVLLAVIVKAQLGDDVQLATEAPLLLAGIAAFGTACGWATLWLALRAREDLASRRGWR